MQLFTKTSLFFAVCVIYVTECAVSRTVTRTLAVDNGGPWGDWGQAEYCAPGTFAVGYNMKIEAPQGFGDDSQLNGIKLLCDSLDGTRYGGEVGSTEGPFGTWQTGQTRCDKVSGLHHFLTQFTIQVESDQGSRSDDTSMNYIKFKCEDFNQREQPFELARAPGKGLFGDFGIWSHGCDAGSAICGIQTRVEQSQGSGDDTGLNDVKMFCCSN